MDKIWQLAAFKIALQQQPVISTLAPILFWLIPILEISIGVLLAYPSRKVQDAGWKSSIVLISVFTVYIGLGVLGIYANKPCMCLSFMNQISWTTHLIINIVILALSVLGLILNKSYLRKARKIGFNGGASIALLLITIFAISGYHYKKTSNKAIKYYWYQLNSLNYYEEHNTVMSPTKGLLASTYDRYPGPYRQFLTKELQTNIFTNQLLVCITERRIAI
jgi:hypothetical protein